uniref:uncharacterized protein LOC120338146 n=1 Tax=Styela clava TaxID=7725 RepID=UPI001939F97C|nr:uncharacterized protein LOC120338146 [Styela clava]
MKFLIVATFAVLFFGAESRRLQPSQCESGRIVIALMGICPMEDAEICRDICDGTEVKDIEECSLTPECCWNGHHCAMKIIPSYIVDKDHTVGEENHDKKVDTSEKTLSRVRRQSSKRNEISIEANAEGKHGRVDAEYRRGH